MLFLVKKNLNSVKHVFLNSSKKIFKTLTQCDEARLDNNCLFTAVDFIKKEDEDI